jgi:hypothetical protein
VLIEVGDENDNTPLTVEPVYYASVAENSPAGVEVVRLEAADLDLHPSPLSFRITAGNAESFFSIHNGECLSLFFLWCAHTQTHTAAGQRFKVGLERSATPEMALIDFLRAADINAGVSFSDAVSKGFDQRALSHHCMRASREKAQKGVKESNALFLY